MKKTNGGFSLIELIVVIAIMAILVGILAPAYLKYVEKSRKSTDVHVFGQVLDAAEAIATDHEIYVPLSSVFNINVLSGEASFKIVQWGEETVIGTSSDPQWKLANDDWNETANKGEPYVFKSKEWSSLSGEIDGKVQKNGTLKWFYSSNGSVVFEKMADYSQAFGDRIYNAEEEDE